MGSHEAFPESHNKIDRGGFEHKPFQIGNSNSHQAEQVHQDRMKRKEEGTLMLARCTYGETWNSETKLDVLAMQSDNVMA